MIYNRDIQRMAPLPTGALPTEEDLDELRNRSNPRFMREVGRLLRGLFSRRASQNYTPLFWPVLNRLGINVSKLCSGQFEDQIAAMKKRCAACGNTETCRRWLAQMSFPDAYRTFCPNAQAFDALPRTLLAE